MIFGELPTDHGFFNGLIDKGKVFHYNTSNIISEETYYGKEAANRNLMHSGRL